MQRFQIIEEQREQMSDRAKCSELIERITSCQQLVMASENLKWQIGRGTLTFEKACNHLQAEVSSNGSNSSGFRNFSSTYMAPSQGNNKKRIGKAHKKGNFIIWHKWSKMT